MQAYGPAFAHVYNLRWEQFALQLAPQLQSFYESTDIGQHNRQLLDLCCGTGQLALYFLDQGYQVTGIDLSPDMLEYARANTAPYVIIGQARFVQADAANFELEERFGMVVSTFDALNHLPDFTALKGCFLSVFPVLEEEGFFIFDLNTPSGLRNWSGMTLEDTPEMMLVTRAIYDEQNQRGYMRVSGFFPVGDGLYERFEETAYNTAFDLEQVKEALLQTGFRSVRFARSQDLNAPAEDPERDSRIFFIAQK